MGTYTWVIVPLVPQGLPHLTSLTGNVHRKRGNVITQLENRIRICHIRIFMTVDASSSFSLTWPDFYLTIWYLVWSAVNYGFGAQQSLNVFELPAVPVQMTNTSSVFSLPVRSVLAFGAIWWLKARTDRMRWNLYCIVVFVLFCETWRGEETVWVTGQLGDMLKKAMSLGHHHFPFSNRLFAVSCWKFGEIEPCSLR